MIVDYKAAVPVLRTAADLLDKKGWTSGRLVDARSRMCAHGAISMAAAERPFYVVTRTDHLADCPDTSDPGAEAAILALYEYLTVDPSPYRFDPDRCGRTAAGGSPGFHINMWNDYDADSGAVVVSAMRNAASWAEGRANA